MGKFTDDYIKLMAEISAHYGVFSKIHEQDMIFDSLLNNPTLPRDIDKVNYYFQDGFQSAKTFLELVGKYLEKKENIKVLEFACGYGRVTRHLIKQGTAIEYYCSDIHPEAMKFINDNIGVGTYLSSDAPENFNPGEKFDVVFALSFFSHMPDSNWGRWLQSLFECVVEDGLLIFTTHGLSSAKLMLIPPSDISEDGFYFKCDSEQGDLDSTKYGTTISLLDYVIRKIADLSHARLVLYEEGFWWKHQDLYILKNIKDYYPEQIIRESNSVVPSKCVHTADSQKNDKILYSFDPEGLYLAHDITGISLRPEVQTFVLNASGTDPIILLPEIQFKSEVEYGLIVYAESPDPVWTVYYLTDDNNVHDVMHRVQFRPTKAAGSDDTLIILPKGLISQRLRIDPGERGGEIKIKRLDVLEISDVDKHTFVRENIIRNKCHDLTPEEWTQLLALSVKHHIVGDMHFPLFPPENIQKSMVGTAGENTIVEMSGFYKALMEGISKISWNFGDETKVLDFGCGFGRLTRFFLKDTSYGNLYGMDVMPKFLHMCQGLFPSSCMPINNFIVNTPLPPSKFQKSSFDLITAFSVFSHLSPDAAGKWMKEFARIIKHGGLLAITVRQRSYLDYCANLLQGADLDQYQELQATVFGKDEATFVKYERGEILYFPSGGGEYLSESFYGDTVIPEKYIIKNWTEDFIIREMFDDRTKVSQAFVLFQRK